MQFSEYLSMDRYKHSASTQRIVPIKCSPKPIKPVNSDNGTVARPTANGTGMQVLSDL